MGGRLFVCKSAADPAVSLCHLEQGNGRQAPRSSVPVEAKQCRKMRRSSMQKGGGLVVVFASVSNVIAVRDFEEDSDS